MDIADNCTLGLEVGSWGQGIDHIREAMAVHERRRAAEVCLQLAPHLEHCEVVGMPHAQAQMLERTKTPV